MRPPGIMWGCGLTGHSRLDRLPRACNHHELKKRHPPSFVAISSPVMDDDLNAPDPIDEILDAFYYDGIDIVSNDEEDCSPEEENEDILEYALHSYLAV